MRSKHEIQSWLKDAGLTAVIVDGKKICRDCQTWIPLDRFYAHRRKELTIYDQRCDPCRLMHQKLRYLVMTPEEYRAILKRARGACELCEAPLDKPNIDHCHDTGAIRGVLCTSCNSGLGQFQDSAEFLRRAANYIEQWSNVRLSPLEKQQGQERKLRIDQMREMCKAIKRKKLAEQPSMRRKAYEEDVAGHNAVAVDVPTSRGSVQIINRRKKSRKLP